MVHGPYVPSSNFDQKRREIILSQCSLPPGIGDDVVPPFSISLGEDGT